MKAKFKIRCRFQQIVDSGMVQHLNQQHFRSTYGSQRLLELRSGRAQETSSGVLGLDQMMGAFFFLALLLGVSGLTLLAEICVFKFRTSKRISVPLPSI